VKLRRKLTLAFFLTSALVSVAITVVMYRFIQHQYETELRGRLGDIAEIGSHSIHLGGYDRLVARFAEVPTTGADTGSAAALVDAIEHSDDYAHASEQLNMLRNAEPSLIRYVYLLAPGADDDHPRFLADADVLQLEAKRAHGDALSGSAADDNISHFGQVYDVGELPALRTALTTCTPQYEPDFEWDEVFKVHSTSAYFPLGGTAGHCLGVIGVDVIDRDMRTALAQVGALAIKISAISIGMGTLLTRPILALTATVKRFANKDFTARTSIRAKDEIGELGTNFNAMAETIQIHSEHLEELVATRTAELVAEKQTSERLLLNVLPLPIAERLKRGESLIVDRFESVSVLFADIVGFTALSARTSPEALVTMLNDLFSMFDELAEEHALEKIKTIGDAYMAVAGIPQPIADHAVAIAHMAMDMQACIARYAAERGLDLTIRIGIHTGSVVAGVIGTKKFIYDLWGDTVNTASRMESHGVASRVHVSEATASLLRTTFELETRDPIDVKGKGRMQTYLISQRLEHVPPRRPSTLGIV
jgi:class 3 adenylate cyclase